MVVPVSINDLISRRDCSKNVKRKVFLSQLIINYVIEFRSVVVVTVVPCT